ncbi:hypothetical protein VH441_03885 [Psychrobacter sp. HD31]|uniref:hypothetical protein n=1 Tax=Psychrobacter sp. HD31 TaxID=3112003 RepID=UPI003DA5F362
MLMLLKNILSIILAFILASLGGLLIIVLFIPLKIWLVPADLSTGIYSNKELLFFLFLSIFLSVWYGFIIAKVSKIKKLQVAMISPCLGVLFFTSEISFPIWYVTISIILSFPLTYFGARLYLKKNGNVSG